MSEEDQPFTRDWKAIEMHLSEMEMAYRELIDEPQCNPSFALMLLAKARARYEAGERTDGLAEEILRFE